MGIYGLGGLEEHVERMESELVIELAVAEEIERDLERAHERSAEAGNGDDEYQEMITKLKETDLRAQQKEYRKSIEQLDVKKGYKGELPDHKPDKIAEAEKAQLRQKRDESIISRLLSEKESKAAKQEVMRNSFSESFTSSMRSAQNLLKNRPDEAMKRFEEMVYGRQDTRRDTVNLSKQGAVRKNQELQEQLKEKKTSVDQFQEKAAKVQKDSSLTQAVISKQMKRSLPEQQQRYVQKFSTGFVKLLYTNDPRNRRELKDLKKEMKASGHFSNQQIDSIQNMVGQAVKSHLAYGMKKQMLRLYFNRGSDNTLEAARDKAALGEMSKMALSMGDLANFDPQSLFPSINLPLAKDMEGFAVDEMTKQMSGLQLGHISEEEYENALKKMLSITKGMGVMISVEELTNSVIKGLEHQGFEIVNEAGLALSAQMGGNTNQGATKDQAPKYVNHQELLEDKLRHLYMVLALNPNLKDKIEIQYKMKKLKNGLLKLGISVTDELVQDGTILAQMKCFESLKENYREQAGIHPLEGEEYEIVKKKRAIILQTLKKLGFRVKRQQLEKVRDQANVEIAPVVREQVQQLEIAISIRRTRYLFQRYKHYLSHLDRLKTETSILENFMPLQDLSKSSHQISSFQELA